MRRIRFKGKGSRVGISSVTLELDDNGYALRAVTPQWEELPQIPEAVFDAATKMPEFYEIAEEEPAAEPAVAAEDAPADDAPEAAETVKPVPHTSPHRRRKAHADAD